MTNGKSPFFSLLVPTRNRPEVIGYCLQSLKMQGFPDFEVIVCDNHTGKPCKSVFDSIADERFQYVVPPSPLEMSDNWEFALRQAKGKYVGVVIDKTVLLPSTLQAVYEKVRESPLDIVSWWSESYYLKDESAGYGPGTYSPAHRAARPERIDPYAELERRFRLDVRRGLEGRHYFQGKICFGVYHADLIKRIQALAGRLFFPLTPDYTSMIAALALAESALDLGRPFVLSFSSTISTGASVARDPAFAKAFHMQIDPEVIGHLPLAGLYTSVHNSVAYDYLQSQKRIGGKLAALKLNRDNLILRAREDVEQQRWNDRAEQSAQEAILDSFLRTVSAGARIKYRLRRFAREFSGVRQSPAARHLLQPLARRFPDFRRTMKIMLRERHQLYWEERNAFSSILEAADAANRHYSGQPAEKVDGKT